MAEVPQYDVCLSCAGEDSAYVDRVAGLLEQKGIRVYYYKAKRSKAWGRSLTRDLGDIYRHQSRFCVVLLSEHYARKAWTQHELKTALVRAFEERVNIFCRRGSMAALAVLRSHCD